MKIQRHAPIGLQCIAIALVALWAGATAAHAADSVPAVLTVRADCSIEVGPLDKAKVLNASQGAYEPMRNLNWLPSAYDNLAAVGIRMIRMDCMVDDKIYRVVSRDEAGNLRYDFSRLDRVIKPMLQKGFTPLMCLCYCPDVLISTGDNASAPKDMDAWKQIVKAFVQHYKDLGHTGWHWEVWNEPDGSYFFRGTLQQYLDMYDKTAEGVKEVDATAKVGGAADASVLSNTCRLFPLLDHIKQNPAVPLDFISYHKYGGSTIDEKPPYDMGWIFDEVAGQVKSRGFAPREIFVTEWNLTPIMDAGPGTANDTHQVASGVAARMYNALGIPGLTKVFYFSPIEGYRPSAIFNGDLGLLTVNNHKKAVYNVFAMFNNLGGTVVKADITGGDAKEHYTWALVTKNAVAGKLAVMMWNYSDREASIELKLDKLPSAMAGKNIRVTRYQIDADHANYYKDYQQGLRGYQTGPSEDLVPVERAIAGPSAEFSTKVILPAYGVGQIMLDPTDLPIGDVPPPAAPSERVVNHAAGKPVTASSSLEKSGWGTKHLVNEITHTLHGTLGFSSDAHDTPDSAEWVGVDLGLAVPVNEVRLYPRDDQEAEGGGFPVDFKIQGSVDLTEWKDLAVETGYGDGRPVPGVQSLKFAANRCRYVRLLATKLGQVASTPVEYRLQLAELEIYARKD